MFVLDANNRWVEPCHLMVTLAVVTVRCSQIDACRHDGHGFDPIGALEICWWPWWSLVWLMSWWWSHEVPDDVVEPMMLLFFIGEGEIHHSGSRLFIFGLEAILTRFGRLNIHISCLWRGRRISLQGYHSFLRSKHSNHKSIFYCGGGDHLHSWAQIPRLGASLFMVSSSKSVNKQAGRCIVELCGDLEGNYYLFSPSLNVLPVSQRG